MKIMRKLTVRTCVPVFLATHIQLHLPVSPVLKLSAALHSPVHMRGRISAKVISVEVEIPETAENDLYPVGCH